MFDRIVVGTDGSANAERALRAVREMTSVEPAAAVRVVTAYRPLSDVQLSQIADQLPREFHPVLSSDMEAERRLDEARAVFRHSSQAVDYHERDDDPTDAILDAADQIDADLIVVGSRGESAAKRAIHGSVATKVLHHAPCSVLVIK